MKNKKVIIITRDVEGTYFQDCCAFKQFDAQIKENKNYPGEHINTYILQFIEEICTNNKDKNKQEIRWNAINKKNKFLVYSKRNEEKGKFASTGVEVEEYFKWLFETTIKTDINKALAVIENEKIDNKPYVYFTHKNNNNEIYDVYFVFLNRIFDTFVNGSEEYKNLINDEKRLDFITAICQDCGLVDKAGKLAKDQQKAMLYIHDKEWYVEGAPYTAMQKGEYTFMAASTKEKQKKLEEYFDTIKVFLHIPSAFFYEITSLRFTDYDLDLDIREREYF